MAGTTLPLLPPPPPPLPKRRLPGALLWTSVPAPPRPHATLLLAVVLRPKVRQPPQSRSGTPPPLVPVTPWNARLWLALILFAKP